jgi:hypothetical protein
MENIGKDDKNDLKTVFNTREGCYRLLNLSEYSRPNRVGYQSNQNSPQVRVSFVSLPQNPAATQNFSMQQQQQQQQSEKGRKNDHKSSRLDRTNIIVNILNFCRSILFFAVGSSSNNNISAKNGMTNGPTTTTTTNSAAATQITSSNSLSSSLTNGLQDHSNCQNSMSHNNNGGCDWICFNFGKELYTYAYRGVKKVCCLKCLVIAESI